MAKGRSKQDSSAKLGYEASLWAATGYKHVLTPGRYVGAEDVEDDGEPFEEKMNRLVQQWRRQQRETVKLDDAIAANFGALGFGEGP